VLNQEPVDLQFNHSGYLFVANESVAHIMEENYSTQRFASQSLLNNSSHPLYLNTRARQERKKN
jgi:FAD-dependent oxidoreductase domain-containing protein 1